MASFKFPSPVEDPVFKREWEGIKGRGIAEGL